VFTTGLVLQELLQGFSGPKVRSQLIERFLLRWPSYNPIATTTSKPPRFGTLVGETAYRSVLLTQC
jgi:hypothetical protein